jgi:uncharacterized Zn finger protein
MSVWYQKIPEYNIKKSSEGVMSFYDMYGPRLSVAELKAKADKFVTALKKKEAIFPVQLEGKHIATTFWGKSWCTNVESYEDYANRVTRGRSYVRHGAVIDLQIKRGQISAQVLGSRPYKIEIKVAPISKERWKTLCQECSGKVGSLIELLQGKLSKEVMAILCQRPDGIFPASQEIEFRCSCPDYADMCKHVAATLYGVGNRLDKDPSIFFLLRSVDEKDLIGEASMDGLLDAQLQAGRNITDDLSGIFGVDFVAAEAPVKTSTKTAKLPPKEKKTTKPRVLAKPQTKVKAKVGAKPQTKIKAATKAKAATKLKIAPKRAKTKATTKTKTTPKKAMWVSVQPKKKAKPKKK